MAQGGGNNKVRIWRELRETSRFWIFWGNGDFFHYMANLLKATGTDGCVVNRPLVSNPDPEGGYMSKIFMMAFSHGWPGPVGHSYL
jgi:hypothetical protein